MTEAPPATPAAAIELCVDAFGRLVLTLPHQAPVVDVVPVRCFPFTAPDERLAFCDPHGHEVCTVDRVEELPLAVRALVLQELARREFIPRITRIHSIAPDSEPSFWHVDTDRGEVHFSLTSEDHVRRLGADGALIVDGVGVRYRIEEVKQLDAQSRVLLARYL